jgi:hypothetical protein
MNRQYSYSDRVLTLDGCEVYSCKIIPALQPPQGCTLWVHAREKLQPSMGLNLGGPKTQLFEHLFA